MKRATEWLWRISAAMLLVVFTTLLCLPGVLALQHGFDASLPACCRAHGQHHCSMGNVASSEPGAQSAFAQVTEKCPCPAAAPSDAHANAFDAGLAELTVAEEISQSAVCAQTEAKRQVSLDRSNRKRGPPPILLPA